MLAHVNAKDFDQQVVESKVPVLVDFYATWCGPCRLLSPVLDELSSEGVGAYKVVKVDVDNEPDLAVRFGVTALPTLILFENGEVTQRIVGLEKKENLRRHLPVGAA